MPGTPDPERPSHPKGAAILLLVGVFVLIVVLSIAPLLG